MTWLLRAICALLISAWLPTQALANSLIPADRWVDAVTTGKPLLPYKLGLVSLATPGQDVATELPTAVRHVLKRAGYFDANASERLHMDIDVQSLSGGVAVVEYTARSGRDAASAKVIYKKRIKAQTQNQSMSDEVTSVRVLAGNLKLFVIDFRNHFDPAFAGQAAPLIAEVNADVDKRGILSHVGEAAMNTMVATVEGTAAVAGTVGEVVTSEEFQRGMVQVAGEVAQQQQQLNAERARMAQLQAAAAREREAKLAAERLAAQQKQAEREQQLAENARWAEAKKREADQFHKLQAEKAAQRVADLARQRKEAEQRQRQARAEAEQRAADVLREAEQSRQRQANQQTGTYGAIIVEQRKPDPVPSAPVPPRPVPQPSNSPSEEWLRYRNFPSKPKNLNCQKEQQCRAACPRNDPGESGACHRACEARSTCKVSLQ